MQDKPEEAVDAFYRKLQFGTGGMRGIMGVGCNRMNVYTIRGATQGLANYLHSQNEENRELSVFIGYDSRENSRTFAEEAAKVLAGNSIKSYLCPDLRPTPLVSFGCRYKHCSAAIMITASHNPKEYNGFKVYWSDGGQVLPPHDVGIVRAANAIETPDQIHSIDTLKSEWIKILDDEVDDAYLKAVKNHSLHPIEDLGTGRSLNIVYTSLHGTGITLAPRALRLLGFKSLSFVESQITVDGTFPTAPYPNPEEKAALQLGIDKLLSNGSDLLIATDPDADRMGVVVLHKGEAVILSGNQIACLLLHHILDSGIKTKKGATVKSIVTTGLFNEISLSNSVHCFEVLPGFKYIAQLIHQWEQEPDGYQFLFGAEESYGYLFGTDARDKDAISASTLIAEAALLAKSEGITLLDRMNQLYIQYGFYLDTQRSVNFEEGKQGTEAMKVAMDNLRSHPPKELAGKAILKIDDFQTGESVEIATNLKSSLSLPPSNFLIYHLEGGSRLMIRPSGTEPKIKIYCSISESCCKGIAEQLDQAKANAESLSQNLLEQAALLLLSKN